MPAACLCAPEACAPHDFAPDVEVVSRLAIRDEVGLQVKVGDRLAIKDEANLQDM